MGMSNTIQQLSVFMENREGRLDEILKILSEAGVNIVALSLADTSEYGMLRMIVSDPHKGRAALKDEGITAMLTDVVALRVPHATGSLSKAMHQIVEGEVNIEYMYAFANGSDAAAVLKSDDPARVIDILKGSGFDVYSADEAYRANMKEKIAGKFSGIYSRWSEMATDNFFIQKETSISDFSRSIKSCRASS